MAFINRIRLSGTSFGSETWSIHIDLSDIGPGTQSGAVSDYEDLLTWAQGIAGHTFWSAAGAFRQMLSPDGFLRSVRVEALGSNNLIQAAEVDGLAIQGTGVVRMPPQAATVVSLLTGRPGRSYRGRIYVPAWGGSLVSPGGRLGSPTTTQVAENVRTIKDICVDECPATFVPKMVVYSPKLDVVTPVTQLSVGDVVDTQRRRRDSMVEVRATVPV